MISTVRKRLPRSAAPSPLMKSRPSRTGSGKNSKRSTREQRFSPGGSANGLIAPSPRSMAFSPSRSGKSVVDKVRGLTEMPMKSNAQVRGLTEESEGIDRKIPLSKIGKYIESKGFLYALSISYIYSIYILHTVCVFLL
jgi:hypothetical protein